MYGSGQYFDHCVEVNWRGEGDVNIMHGQNGLVRTEFTPGFPAYVHALLLLRTSSGSSK